MKCQSTTPNRCTRNPWARNQSNRSGQTSIEVVATTAIMVPVCGLLFFTGIKLCQYLYSTIGNSVTWPFM